MQIGPYTLGRELGRGAMGVVYEAHDALLDRPLAVKVVPASSQLDITQVRREARAAARLRHPHVVGLHAAGREDLHVWLAMDLIDGPALKDLIREHGPLEPRRAARIALDLAEALHYAHGKGVLHRDIKPQNVLIDEDDQPYLADFGLSKLLDPTATQLTETGDMIGTPAYAAPEQLQGELGKVGPATDVYGLGGVLFEMLCGEPPFQKQSADQASLIQAVLHQPPVLPPAVNEGIDPALRKICLRCLAKHPGGRFHTAGELALALRAYLDTGRSLRRGAAPTWVGVAALALGVLLGVATTLGLGLRLEDDPLSPDLQRLYDRGYNRAAREDHEGALEDFLAVLAERPEHTWVWFRVGVARSGQDDHTGALEALDRALAGDLSGLEDGDVATIHLHRATTFWELKRDAEGWESIERARELSPLSSDVWHVRSMLRSRLEGDTEALADSNRAVEFDPRNHIARFQRAMFLAAQEPPPADSELLGELEEISTLAPDFWLAPYNQGLLYQGGGDTKAALDAYRRAMLVQLESAKPFSASGLLRIDTNDWIDAYGDFAFAQALEPDDPTHLWSRAAVLHQMGVRLEALDDLDRALELMDESHKDYQALIEWRGRLLNELRQQGR